MIALPLQPIQSAVRDDIRPFVRLAQQAGPLQVKKTLPHLLVHPLPLPRGDACFQSAVPNQTKAVIDDIAELGPRSWGAGEKREDRLGPTALGRPAPFPCLG